MIPKGIIKLLEPYSTCLYGSMTLSDNFYGRENFTNHVKML